MLPGHEPYHIYSYPSYPTFSRIRHSQAEGQLSCYFTSVENKSHFGPHTTLEISEKLGLDISPIQLPTPSILITKIHRKCSHSCNNV